VAEDWQRDRAPGASSSAVSSSSANFSEEVLAQINKRLTLNLLIQGAAAHTFLTAHHLVKDSLEAIHPGLTRLYDRCAVSFHLNYFIGDIPLVYGLPSRFWRRTRGPDHPFHRHRILAERGRELWRASKRFLLKRGWPRGVIGIPGFHYPQEMTLFLKVYRTERDYKRRLAELAKQAIAEVWGIDEDRLDAELTTSVAFGNLRLPRTKIGQMTRQAAIGYGGVELRGDQFTVVAKSWNFPLVVHELSKGTAELVCLHGLNTLDDATYEFATAEADQLEYETWLLQAGPEAWRRFLAAIPPGHTLPATLMHAARLAPAALETLMFAVIDDTPRAQAMLKELAT
jgi:hypothetical protein